MMKTPGNLVWLSAVVLSVGVASAATQSMSLAGSWGFRMDPQGEGEAKAWFASGMEESIQLPGTMDEGGKGIPNTQRDFTEHLSRERTYKGLAWYQREIGIPRS